MNEIKCPACGSTISIDEDNYSNIIKQVRDQEFEDEIIPTSYIKENSTYSQYAGYVTYWTVKEVYTEDTEMYQFYYLLN